MELPNELIIFKNKDKYFHESWTKKRNMLNFPHPSRVLLCAPPNCGKTNTILNLIIRSDPAFEKIIVIHCDGDYTEEYDDIDAEIYSEVPSPADFEGDVKTLIILDDLEYKNMDKKQQGNLDRLSGYVSTHKNISVYITAQNFFNISPNIRRNLNVFIIWKSPDSANMKNISNKIGIKYDKMEQIFDTFDKSTDSLWIDKTAKTPYPIRKNGFIVI